MLFIFFFQAEDGIRDYKVTGVQTCALPILVGVTSALAQRDYRRVLSFNLVGHIGYTTMGLGLLTPLGLAGSLLYVIHHIIEIGRASCREREKISVIAV